MDKRAVKVQSKVILNTVGGGGVEEITSKARSGLGVILLRGGWDGGASINPFLSSLPLFVS